MIHSWKKLKIEVTEVEALIHTLLRHIMFYSCFRLLFVLILCFVGSSEVLTPQLWAQDLVENEPEIKAVFRISRQYVKQAIEQEELIASIPIRATIAGLDSSGTINGLGKLSVELQSSGEEAKLIVRSKGTGSACVTGVRGPIVAYVPSGGPFTTCSTINFDGRNFSPECTEANVNIHLRLQRITTRRDRLPGRMLGAMARPIGKRMVKRARPQAKRVTERAIVGFVNDEMDKNLAKLNEELPVDDTVNRLFPKAKDWKFYLAVEQSFIQAAFGPAGLSMPPLPEVPSSSENVMFEAWLRSTNDEAEALEALGKRPLAKRLVDTYLEATLPKLAALAGEKSITAMGSWVVISVASPGQN